MADGGSIFSQPQRAEVFLANHRDVLGAVCSFMSIVVPSGHVCFPSLPPVLLPGFESRLGLESLGCSMWHFLKLVARVFSGYSGFLPSFFGLMIQPTK